MQETPHILLASSNAKTRFQLRNILFKAGFTSISEVTTGHEAVNTLRSTPIGILIIDIDLVGLDCWRLARLVRSGIFRCEATTPFILVAETWCERIAETTAREFGITELLHLALKERLPEIVKRSLHQPGKLFNNPSILLIEDNQDTAQITYRALQHRFDVEIAPDGVSGLNSWKEGHHDLVLLDVMLPGMSGPEVLEKILHFDKNQPVVIITAYSTVDLAEELMLKGAVDFISKPFRADQLRRVCELAARREDYMVSNAQFADRLASLEESHKTCQALAAAHQRLLDNLGTVVLELDQDLKLTFLNRAWSRLTGFGIQESLHKPLQSFLPEEGTQGFQPLPDNLKPILSGQETDCKFDLRLINREGQTIWVECKLDAIWDDDNCLTLSGCLDNISERKKAQNQLEFMAMHDHLTGIYNRHYFDNALSHMVAGSARGKGTHALMFLDLDHFKVVNDTYGHYYGDIILREIAGLLASRTRKADVLCRIGGDEFALLISNIQSEELLRIAEETRKQIQAYQVPAGDEKITLGCSIGVAIISGHTNRPEEYLKQADIALYVAKRRGRNCVHIFNPGDSESTEFQNGLERVKQLHHAIKEDRLTLFFRPVVAIDSSEVAFFEGVIYLDMPGEGVISPEQFLPALELTGEMSLFDQQTVILAVAALKKHPSLGRIAITLSCQAFQDESTANLIEQQLNREGLEPDRLIIEISDCATLINLSNCQQILETLKKLGCHLAIGDLGSGFSSFGFLKQFPAELIKIDSSFISGLDNNPVDHALVKAVSEVATALGKKTVADGIENEEALRLLNIIGVDFGKGDHIGQPVRIGQILTGSQISTCGIKEGVNSKT